MLAAALLSAKNEGGGGNLFKRPRISVDIRRKFCQNLDLPNFGPSRNTAHGAQIVYITLRISRNH